MNNNSRDKGIIEPENDKLVAGFERLVKLDKKRSELCGSQIKKIWKKVIGSIEHKLSFDEYLIMLSESIDKNIIETQKQDKEKVFVGGHIFFKISEDKKYLQFNVDNYYKKGEEWFKNQSSGKTALSKFNSDSVQRLKDIWEKQKNGEEWKYNIDPPEFNSQL